MNKDLFETTAETQLPLAARMRPRNLDEYIGQEHIVGKGRLLRRAIQADRLSSVIFFGPPGTGKTTLARVIANHTKSNFLSLNAVLAGVQHIRDAIASAEEHKKLYGKTTILFIDEVHRWNRAQQDALLPWVENGTVIFIGATTENPFFEVNKALVSRSRVFQLKTLTDEDLYQAAERCLQDHERGYGRWKVSFTEGALEHLIKTAAGDARSLLNALELAVETSVDRWPPPDGTALTIDRAAAEESIQQKVVLYDKDGDYHYDIISAFIKSIRGSDPDAALYWLARMVRAGESPHFIFRRLLISACEDIGLAEPTALAVVTAAAEAFDRVGLPEGRYHLTHATLYLATCPKSNSALGFFDALQAVEKENTEVPNHLKDANRDAKDLGHGEGYLYPHAYRDHWVAQQYLPDAFLGTVFYTPGQTGYEKKIRDEVFSKREAQLAVMEETHSEDKHAYTEEDWHIRSESTGAQLLERIRDAMIRYAALRAEDRVLVYRADNGLLLWSSARITETGCTAGLFQSQKALDAAKKYAGAFDSLMRPFTALIPAQASAPADQSGAAPSDSGAVFPDIDFDVALSYNPAETAEDFTAFFTCLRAENTHHARIVCAFPLPQNGLRLSALFSASDETGGRQDGQTTLPPPPPQTLTRFIEAETAFFSNKAHKRFAWTEHTVAALAEQTGYTVKERRKESYREKRLITQPELARWFSPDSEYGNAIRAAFPPEQHSGLETLIKLLEQRCKQPVSYTRTVIYMMLKREKSDR